MYSGWFLYENNERRSARINEYELESSTTISNEVPRLMNVKPKNLENAINDITDRINETTIKMLEFMVILTFW